MEELERYQPLIVIHANHRIVFTMHGEMEERVRRKRANGIYPFLPGGVYGGSDDIFFLRAEKTTLTAMGVQGKNPNDSS
jgi:hypothetical protein